MAKTFQNFLNNKSMPGILLCLAAIIAMIMENSPLQIVYDAIKNTPVIIQIGSFAIAKPFLLWVNDGLMAIFFLLVGLEIKREMMVGHLSNPSKFALPAIASIGGVLVPAAIYAYINWNIPETLQGWAIPAATDIAFALGILMMLGNRVPASLKICLVAIAIIDDLIAIVIIAFFYTEEMSIISLGLAGLGLACLYAFNRKGVTNLSPYVVVGILIWVCVLKSGVHATLAGVAIGLMIPLKARNKDDKSPLKVLEHILYPWVSFVILPVFAFANAGISLQGVKLETFMQPLTLGIILGLFLGKQIGVMAFTAIAVYFKVCSLPNRVSWAQFYGVSLLTGVGFTMSLFVGTLAFTDLTYAPDVRLGVLTGSLFSAVAGVVVLLLSTKKNQ